MSSWHIRGAGEGPGENWRAWNGAGPGQAGPAGRARAGGRGRAGERGRARAGGASSLTTFLNPNRITLPPPPVMLSRYTATSTL